MSNYRLSFKDLIKGLWVSLICIGPVQGLIVRDVQISFETSSMNQARLHAVEQAQLEALLRVVGKGALSLNANEIALLKSNPQLAELFVNQITVQFERAHGSSYRASFEVDLMDKALARASEILKDKGKLENITSAPGNYVDKGGLENIQVNSSTLTHPSTLPQRGTQELRAKKPDRVRKKTGVYSSILIPVYASLDSTFLWTADNPWIVMRATLLSARDMLLPRGDLRDMQVITAEDILTKNFDRINKFTTYYGIDRVTVVALSEISNEPFRGKASIHRFQNGKTYPQKDLISAPGKSRESFMEEVLETAENDEFDPLDARDSKEKIEPLTPEISIGLLSAQPVYVTFASFEQWHRITQALEQIKGLEFFTKRFSKGRAVIEVNYPSGQLSLQKELHEKGLDLKRQGDDLLVNDMKESLSSLKEGSSAEQAADLSVLDDHSKNMLAASKNPLEPNLH